MLYTLYNINTQHSLKEKESCERKRKIGAEVYSSLQRVRKTGAELDCLIGYIERFRQVCLKI